MSLLNNLKDFFIPAEVEDENETSYKPAAEEPEKNESTYSSSSNNASAGNASTSRQSSYVGQHEERRSTNNYSANTASASSARSSYSSSPTLQVILVKPTEYTDAKKIADHLMNGRTVVLVLEEASEQTRRRIIDFLIGVAYAMNGNLKPIANQTYIVTPHDVGLVDQLVNELGKNYTGSDSASTASLI